MHDILGCIYVLGYFFAREIGCASPRIAATQAYTGQVFLIAVVAGTIAASLCAVPSTLASASRVDSNRNVTGASSSVTFQEGGPQSSFDSQVSTLGESSYADVFTGTSLESNGLLDIYVASGQDDSAFLNAVAAVNVDNLPFNVVPVPNSYTYLDSLTNNLAAAQSSLAAQGVLLSGWSPDPSSGTVEVSFAPPTPEALQALATTAQGMNIATPVTSANYITIAGLVLQANFANAALTIQQATQPLPQGFANGTRNNDHTPWNGGDQIWSSAGNGCASGFGIYNTTTLNESLITAGHCGTGGWFSTSTLTRRIGVVTNRYFENANNDDFELIGTNVSGLVYTGSPSSSSQVNVTGAANPGVGDLVTFDGPSLGEISGVSIQAKDACQLFKNPLGGETYLACHLDKTSNKPPVGAPGDSGAPIIRKETGSSDVTAVGTLVGGNSSNVFFEKIQNELRRAGANLLVTTP